MKKLRFYHYYILISTFCIVIFLFHLWNTQKLSQNLKESIKHHGVSIHLVNSLNTIQSNLEELNRPGNNVFVSKNEVLEATNYQLSLKIFEKNFQNFISESKNDLLPQNIKQIINREIENVYSALEAHQNNSQLIFQDFSKKNIAKSAEYMAHMDKNYSEIKNRFNQIQKVLIFDQDYTITQQTLHFYKLQESQYIFFTLLTLIIIASGYSTYKSFKHQTNLTQEKTGLLNQIYNQKQELENVLQTHSSLIQILDQSAIISKTDVKGNITFINENFVNISGHNKEELIGSNHRLLKSNEHPASFYKEIWQTLLSKKTWSGEIKNKKKNGEFYWVDSTIGPILDSNGNISEFVSIRYDITSKKIAEQQVLENQKLDSIGKLAAGIAHDFNNLLSGVLGYAGFLKEELSEQPKLFKHADIIEKSALRGAELTKQLLGFARKGKYEKKIINMNELIEEVRVLLYRSIDKNIVIKFSLDPNLNQIMGDSSQLIQVLVNLGINARDAMPKGGEILFESHNFEMDEEHIKVYPNLKKGSYVQISITDTGRGIPKEIISKIYDPFFTTKEIGKGTGLGLAMVHGIIQNHNGNIQVYSEENIGTRFNIYLPISSESKSLNNKSSLNQKLNSNLSLNGKKVLIVDDEEVIRFLANEMLKKMKAETMLASNGQEALELIKKEKDNLHAVLLDVMMPIMDGLRTFRYIRETYSQLPIIFASGYSESEEISKLRQEGPTYFIQKPYHKSDLIDLLEKIGRS